MIERLTRQQLAERASNRWDAQYPPELCDKDKAAIGHQLRAMPFANPSLVEAIVGNSSWTQLECDPCGRSVEQVACFTPNYTSDRHIYVCDGCLRKALEMAV